ncbi:MAG: thioredoxin family protein [Sulfuriferula multivorans]|uniref:Thioredoxin family protein n=1 Tax=Sulfuriferula multivorans TaxID=1559896 RepID=A0A7C9P973_9PROT|nr:thioredoxin family protein [Sulfuriferula multivorans]
MDVMIIATKACSHRKNMETELESLRITYRVYCVEDPVDLVEKFSIRHSPNLIVDDEVVVRKQPTEAELQMLDVNNSAIIHQHQPSVKHHLN